MPFLCCHKVFNSKQICIDQNMGCLLKYIISLENSFMHNCEKLRIFVWEFCKTQYSIFCLNTSYLTTDGGTWSNIMTNIFCRNILWTLTVSFTIRKAFCLEIYCELWQTSLLNVSKSTKRKDSKIQIGFLWTISFLADCQIGNIWLSYSAFMISYKILL